MPKSELDGEMGDAHMAMQARLMSQALRKLSHSLSQSQTILVFINQVPFCSFGPIIDRIRLVFCLHLFMRSVLIYLKL